MREKTPRDRTRFTALACALVVPIGLLVELPTSSGGPIAGASVRSPSIELGGEKTAQLVLDRDDECATST